MKNPVIEGWNFELIVKNQNCYLLIYKYIVGKNIPDEHTADKKYPWIASKIYSEPSWNPLISHFSKIYTKIGSLFIYK